MTAGKIKTFIPREEMDAAWDFTAVSSTKAAGGDGGGLGFVGGIDDEGGGEVGVEFGDAEGSGFVAELGEHFVGRAFQGFAADDGTDGDYFLLLGAQFVVDLRDGQDRADADERVAGADEDAVSFAEGF